MVDFVFITDLHLTSSSRVRNGNVLDDICNKLKYVVDYCNNNNAVLLIGGDVFDKPSVPDLVKSAFANVLRGLKTGVISINGNHDLLYGNPEFSYKTSYNLVSEFGLWTDLSDVKHIDMGEVVLTSTLPIVPQGKPQIVLFHGFLNQEDGPNTLHFADIQTDEPTYICLGHDHVEYEPYVHGTSVKIFRPGSLLRGIRQDSQLRQPKLLHIRVKDGKLQNKLVTIPCRSHEEIFSTKEFKNSKAEVHKSYDEIISQIRDFQKTDLTFEDAVNQVSSPDVASYVLKLRDQAKLENSIKRQNL